MNTAPPRIMSTTCPTETRQLPHPTLDPRLASAKTACLGLLVGYRPLLSCCQGMGGRGGG